MYQIPRNMNPDDKYQIFLSTCNNCKLSLICIFNMTYKQDIGSKGEDLAVAYLRERQFSILHRNWRSKSHEVDIIALKKNKIHFVEVKTRTGLQYGYPEESISSRKMNSLKKAAIAYLEANPNYTQIQFDVIAIVLQKDKTPEITSITDVFF